MLARLRPPPAQLCQLQPVPVCIQKGTFHRDCTTRGPGRCFHGGRRQAVLIGFDLSAAFDTVDHRLLLDLLRLKFGVTEIPLRWLQSCLEGRAQFIKMGQHESHATEVDVGVPQGSVSPIRRRHAVPSRRARRQHTRRAVRSRRVYH